MSTYNHPQQPVTTLSGIVESANDSLKGRVIELSLADLNNDQEQSFRKIKLRVEDVSVRLPHRTAKIITDGLCRVKTA